MRRIKDPWQKLTSGLYVPPYIKFAPPGHPCCCDETVECAFCTGASPEQMEVTLSNVTNGTCVDCDVLWNNTFVLDRYLGSPCDWSYFFAQTCFGSALSRVNALFDSSSEFLVRVYTRLPEIVHFRKTIASCSMTDENIPYSAGDDVECDFSAATCTVTSL